VASLYRHFDINGRLLYVGISLNAAARLSQHRTSKWFNEIASVTVEHFDDAQAAKRAEGEAIFKELPLYNVAGVRSVETVALDELGYRTPENHLATANPLTVSPIPEPRKFRPGSNRRVIVLTPNPHPSADLEYSDEFMALRQAYTGDVLLCSGMKLSLAGEIQAEREGIIVAEDPFYEEGRASEIIGKPVTRDMINRACGPRYVRLLK
jgi:hypothetical protein